MKIAIITLPGNFNYGNRLQNYALQEVLNKMGYEVETLVPQKDKKNIKMFIYEKLSIVKSILFFNYIEKNRQKKSYKKMKLMKEREFVPFTQEYIKNFYIEKGTEAELNKINEEFDYFVIGSDQVWNPYYISNYDFYFAKFADKNKRVSYAASFGISEIPSRFAKPFKENLNEMKSITVREEAGAKIVKEYTNENVDVVLDPTLLLTKKEWLELASNSKETSNLCTLRKPYILVYILNRDFQENFKKIQDFSKERDIEIVTVMGDYYDENHIVSNPKDFINLINNAEYVFTDSFHAVVFSIIMHTKFLAFKREQMNSRIETLLEICELKENYNAIKNDRLNPNIDKVDFDSVDKVLDIERKKSKNILSSLF